MLEFYNFRRAELTKAKPNLAHIIIAALEKHFNLTLVTQNVDNLHERAAQTKNIVHLHGSLVSYTNPSKTERWPWPEGKEIKLGDLDPKEISCGPILSGLAKCCMKRTLKPPPLQLPRPMFVLL